MESGNSDPIYDYSAEYDQGYADMILYISAVEDALFTGFSWRHEFPPDIIMLALHKASFDVQYSASILMNAAETLNSCKPCRHLLQSRCVRSDCYFDHELHCVPCRYWLLHNTCTRIESGECPFMHDLPDLPTSDAIGSKDTQEVTLHSTAAESWPSLSGAPVSRDRAKAPAPSSSSAVTASAPSTADTEAFPSLSASMASSSSSKKQKAKQNVSSKAVDNSYAAAALITPAASKSDATSSASSTNPPGLHTVFGCSAFDERAFLRELSELGYYAHSTSSTAAPRSNTSIASRAIAAEDWVSSGKELRADYEALRSTAADLAAARNKLLQEATNAFVGGARQIAKNLSTKGHILSQQMKAAHLQAAQALFRLRNGDPRQLLRGVLDLHGLHVQESEELLRQLVPLFVRCTALQQLRLITGSGHHSVAYGHGTARLLPALRALCSDEFVSAGYVLAGDRGVREVKDDNGYVSALQVQLRR